MRILVSWSRINRRVFWSKLGCAGRPRCDVPRASGACPATAVKRSADRQPPRRRHDHAQGGHRRQMWEKWVMLASIGGINCLMRGNVGEDRHGAGGVDFSLSFLDEVTAVVTALGHQPGEGVPCRHRGSAGAAKVFNANVIDVSGPSAGSSRRSRADPRGSARPRTAGSGSRRRSLRRHSRICRFIRTLTLTLELRRGAIQTDTGVRATNPDATRPGRLGKSGRFRAPGLGVHANVARAKHLLSIRPVPIGVAIEEIVLLAECSLDRTSGEGRSALGRFAGVAWPCRSAFVWIS